MAIYPLATWRPIPSSTDPWIVPIGVILHVDAGNAPSLYHWFNGPSGGIESHFHVAKDGTIEQYRDTGQEADANYLANSFMRNGIRFGYLSVETQGYASGVWTDAQLDAIKDLLTWVRKAHGIPWRVPTVWDEGGVGYHIMFGAPGAWTPVSKTCPGPSRIEQFNDVIVPWIEGEEVDRNTIVDSGSEALGPAFDKAVEAGVFSQYTQPGKVVIVDELAAFLERSGTLTRAKQAGKLWTKTQITALITASVGAGYGVVPVVEEIARRIANG